MTKSQSPVSRALVEAHQSISYRWSRVRAMAKEELLDRVRQALGKRWDVMRYRVAGEGNHAVSNRPGLQPSKFFFEASDVPGRVELLREYLPGTVEEIVKRAQRICGHRLDLLGYADLHYGSTPDWHYDIVHGKRAPLKPWFQVRYLDFDEVGDAKIICELNRHQHLVTLAKAFRLTGNEEFARELFRQWYDWVACNPYPLGINWASSLEVAFRSLSWLWIDRLLADSPVVPAGFRSQLLQALWHHGKHIERYLSTYFSANTHLLGEGLALLFLGVACPEIRSAGRWKAKGWDIVVQEAERQIQSDGMHFEQSTYYHVYALDMLLHARILASRCEVPIPEAYERAIKQMLEALFNISQAGVVPRFGDDDGGRLFDPTRNRTEHLLDPLATGAALFHRSDFAARAGGLCEETIWLLGEAALGPFSGLSGVQPQLRSQALPASGLFVMSSPGEIPAQLTVDAGAQGSGTAGHGHADALSVQVAAGGREVLVDPGSFEYVGPAGARNWFRGTSAHNTVCVDNQDQAQCAAPFRWKALPAVAAERWVTGDRFDYFRGSHEGYARLAGAPLHQRCIFARKGYFWLIRDLVMGSGLHHLEITWNFAPSLRPRDDRHDIFVPQDDPGAGVAVVAPDGEGWSRKIVTGSRSPAYGYQEPILVLRFSRQTELPTEFATLLILVSADQKVASVLQKRNMSKETNVYSYHCLAEEHDFYFAARAEPWVAGDWESDAEFIYCGLTTRGLELFLLNGGYLKVGGQRLFWSSQPMSHCEIFLDSEGVQIASPQRSSMILEPVLQEWAKAKLATMYRATSELLSGV